MAAPSGEHVVRGGRDGGLTDKYHYDATSDAPVAGFVKLSGNAGDVSLSTGQVDGSHFEDENGTYKQV